MDIISLIVGVVAGWISAAGGLWLWYHKRKVTRAPAREAIDLQVNAAIWARVTAETEHLHLQIEEARDRRVDDTDLSIALALANDDFTRLLEVSEDLRDHMYQTIAVLSSTGTGVAGTHLLGCPPDGGLYSVFEIFYDQFQRVREHLPSEFDPEFADQIAAAVRRVHPAT